MDVREVPVLMRLVLLFIAVPLTELFLLLWVSSQTSAVFTFAMVITTGMVGATVARQQGWQTWKRIQEQLAAGQAPASEMVDGLLILVAGALLITPGILTDLFGFLLLVPTGRSYLKRAASEWLKARAVVRFGGVSQNPADGPRAPSAAAGDTVIDAEFTRRPAPGHDE